MQLVRTRHRVGDRDVIMASDGDLDDPVSRYLRRGWQPSDHALLAGQLLGPNDLLLDLGANYGMFCIPAVIESGARCLAIEALQANVAVLHAAIAANELDDLITWVLAAITEQSGEVRIKGVSAYGTVGEEGTRVLSYSLDDMMDEFALGSVAMVKMDIEGCELPALHGASRFLDANPDATFIFEANAAHCFRTGSRPQDLVAFFEARGYLVYLCLGRHLVRRSSTDFQDTGVSDYVATKEPLEARVSGFVFDEFSESARIAQTLKTLTHPISGYRLSSVQQIPFAPQFIRDDPEVARLLGTDGPRSSTMNPTTAAPSTSDAGPSRPMPVPNSNTSESRPALERNTVQWAYRLLLGREPESDDAILAQIKAAPDIPSLRKRLLESDEYRRKNPGSRGPTLDGSEPPMSIDTSLSKDVLRDLLIHIESTWARLGQEEPHWSVSSGEQFKRANIATNIDAFYGRGETVVRNFISTLLRNGLDPTTYRTVLDFGCGLCRNAVWLAKQFDRVYGYDISTSHLRLAREYLDVHDIKNVELRHLSVDVLDTLEKVDVAFSVIVLQHNPPPLIAVLVDRLLSALNPGGVAYFQVPTYRIGYSFDINDYLRGVGRSEGMEMHVLPQRQIFEIAGRHNCRVIEVVEDSWTGRRFKEVSNTFLIEKNHPTAG